MTTVTASELAKKLNKSKGRISQMVSNGQLAGCYKGEGRHRRFDLEKCRAALGQRLDPGQMLGNGAGTREALQSLADQQDGELPLGQSETGSGARRLTEEDPDGYSLARTQKAVEEARKLRRQNAEAEGLYVLASEVELEVKKLIGQEIAEFEQVMRVAARAVADEFGADFKSVKKIMVDTWRAHRDKRSRKLADDARAADMSEDEKAQDC